MHGIRPKKFLGQHFLNDQNIANKIVNALSWESDSEHIFEIGPGTGALTSILVQRKFGKLILLEIDRESISWLRKNYIAKNIEIIEGDFLKKSLSSFTNSDISIIGNFPYNISSQIFFKILENRNMVKEVVCMLQKEVGKRICADHGNKTYGILSVLIGAYYDTEILFNVPPQVFIPQPKVDSVVIKLIRKKNNSSNYDESLFKKIVKQGFQNRRKTLRNALKPILLSAELTQDKIFNQRAEQLSVDDFIYLTQKIQNWKT